MKRKVFAVIAFFMCLFLFVGCTDKGIQGAWELYEEVESDGDKVSKKELEDMGVNEKYIVEGEDIHYSCSIPGMKKDIEFDMKLVDKGDNKYDFMFSEKMTFASVEVHGEYMTYYSGEGSDQTKMIFKRVK